MAFLLILFGAALVDVGYRNTGDQFSALLKNDAPAFAPWAGAIVLIGMLGYVKVLRTPSHLLLALVILVLFLSNHGIFANLSQALTNPPSPTTPEQLPSTDVQALEQGPSITVNLPSGLSSTTSGPAGILNGINGAVQGVGKAIGGFLGLSTLFGL